MVNQIEGRDYLLRQSGAAVEAQTNAALTKNAGGDAREGGGCRAGGDGRPRG